MERHVIAAAVRVLKSAGDHQTPANRDIEVLKRFAPNLTTSQPDELACEIIQSEIQKRRKAESATASD